MDDVINPDNINFSLPYLKYKKGFDSLKLLFLLLCTCNHLNAQDTINAGTTGLRLIDNIKMFRMSVLNNRNKKMVDLRELIPDLGMDLKYASDNNFVGVTLYPKLHTTFLRAPAALSLVAIQKELHRKGLGLKIFDAYRPYSVTVKMWELIKDDRYVADPKKGSGHNRGLAVDLTIIELKSGKELNMGTGFDNFTDTAHHNFQALPAEVIKNRELLKATMQKHNFKPLNTEWWHYSYPTEVEYELLDLEFEVLGIGF